MLIFSLNLMKYTVNPIIVVIQIINVFYIAPLKVALSGKAKAKGPVFML